MLRWLRVAVLGFGIVFGLSVAAPAARQGAGSPPAPQWIMVTVVNVQPGAAADWRRIQQEEVLPALKKAGSRGREVWTTGVFGIGSEYVTVTPIESFAQFDGPSPIARALGQEGATALGAKLSKLETGRRSYALRTRPDLSYVPDPNRAPRLAMVSVVEIASGRNADFEALVKSDVLPAMKKAQVKGYQVSQVVYGGNPQEVVSLVSYDTFEEIGKGHPFELALGAAGATKLMQKAGGIVTRFERFVSRYVPELSFSAGKPGTSAQ